MSPLYTRTEDLRRLLAALIPIAEGIRTAAHAEVVNHRTSADRNALAQLMTASRQATTLLASLRSADDAGLDVLACLSAAEMPVERRVWVG